MGDFTEEDVALAMNFALARKSDHVEAAAVDGMFEVMTGCTTPILRKFYLWRDMNGVKRRVTMIDESLYICVDNGNAHDFVVGSIANDILDYFRNLINRGFTVCGRAPHTLGPALREPDASYGLASNDRAHLIVEVGVNESVEWLARIAEQYMAHAPHITAVIVVKVFPPERSMLDQVAMVAFLYTKELGQVVTNAVPDTIVSFGTAALSPEQHDRVLAATKADPFNFTGAGYSDAPVADGNKKPVYELRVPKGAVLPIASTSTKHALVEGDLVVKLNAVQMCAVEGLRKDFSHKEV